MFGMEAGAGYFSGFKMATDIFHGSVVLEWGGGGLDLC